MICAPLLHALPSHRFLRYQPQQFSYCCLRQPVATDLVSARTLALIAAVANPNWPDSTIFVPNTLGATGITRWRDHQMCYFPTEGLARTNAT